MKKKRFECPKSIGNYEKRKKKCLESQTLGRRVICPIDPANQRIADCRISENIEKTSKLSIFAWKVDGYTLDRVTHVCYSAQTIARQKFYTSQMGPNF